MKTWKRIAALCLSVSTMGVSLFGTACEGIVDGFLSSSQGSLAESSIKDSSSEVHTHEWTEEVVKAATCTEDGKKVSKCACGEEKDETVIPAGHSLIRDRETNATCTQEGLTRIYCENCEYETQEIEEKKDHLFLFGGDCFWCGKSKTQIEDSMFGQDLEVVDYDGSVVSITFYHTMGYVRQEILDQHIAAFNAIYPNIIVTHKTMGDYDSLRDRINGEIVLGTAPNLAYCYTDHVALYNKAGVAETLDEYIEHANMGFTEEEKGQFVSAFYEEGRAFGDGKMYTLPYSKSTEVLYYNKTFFEDNNLVVPSTWDEMETLLQYIKAIDPACVPLGYDTDANWFITMCQQLGTPYTSSVEGEKFLFNMEENRQFVERFRQWYQNGWVTTGEIFGDYTSSLFTEMSTYMTIGSSAGASYHCPASYIDDNGQVAYPFEVGVAQIPQIDPSNPKAIAQGASLCMFKKGSEQERAATWLFMKFLTTNPALQAHFSMGSGYAPVIKDLDKKVPVYKDFLESADGNVNLQISAIKQCLAQESAMFASPAFVGSAGARDEIGLLMKNCLLGGPASGQSVADFIKQEFDKSIFELTYKYGA